MIKRKTLEAGALEEEVVRRDKVTAMTALQRLADFHFRHYLEVVSFHAEWAANGIEIGHMATGAKSLLLSSESPLSNPTLRNRILKGDAET